MGSRIAVRASCKEQLLTLLQEVLLTGS